MKRVCRKKDTWWSASTAVWLARLDLEKNAFVESPAWQQKRERRLAPTTTQQRQRHATTHTNGLHGISQRLHWRIASQRTAARARHTHTERFSLPSRPCLYLFWPNTKIFTKILHDLRGEPNTSPPFLSFLIHISENLQSYIVNLNII